MLKLTTYQPLQDNLGIMLEEMMSSTKSSLEDLFQAAYGMR